MVMKHVVNIKPPRPGYGFGFAFCLQVGKLNVFACRNSCLCGQVWARNLTNYHHLLVQIEIKLGIKMISYLMVLHKLQLLERGMVDIEKCDRTSVFFLLSGLGVSWHNNPKFAENNLPMYLSSSSQKVVSFWSLFDNCDKSIFI